VTRDQTLDPQPSRRLFELVLSGIPEQIATASV
jgi:hypothetical protein